MAHMIEDDRRFFEVGNEAGIGLAWHKLGTVVPRDMAGKISVEDAFRLGGLVFDVRTYKLAYQLPDGSYWNVDDKYVIVREAHEFDGKTIGAHVIGDKIVSGDYKPIDNSTIARTLEGLNKKWPVETCGVLRGGRTIFATFDAGEFAIKGDACKMFLLAHEPKDGTGALNIMITPVRVVCRNTLDMGIDAAQWSANVRHNASASVDLEMWSRVLPELADKAGEIRSTLEALAARAAKPADVKKILDAAFPQPKRPSKLLVTEFARDALTEADLERLSQDSHRFDTHAAYARDMRAMAVERLDVFNQENPKISGTLYAVCQAANEVAMWRPSKGDWRTLYEGQLLGKRASTSAAAFRTAVALISKS